MDAKQRISDETNRIEEDCLYSAKGHFNAASLWGAIHLWLGIPSAALSAIAGASALSEFQYHAQIAGGLAIIVAVLTAVSTFLNPQERAAVHHAAGNKYNSTRNQARIFRELRLSLTSLPDEKLLESLEALSRDRDKLNQESPRIPWIAFSRARKGIEEGEATYRVDTN